MNLTIALLLLLVSITEAFISSPHFAYDSYTNTFTRRGNSTLQGRYYFDISNRKIRTDDYIENGVAATLSIGYNRADLNETIEYLPPHCSITHQNNTVFHSPFVNFENIPPSSTAVIRGEKCYLYIDKATGAELCVLEDNTTVVYWKYPDTVLPSVLYEVYMYNYCDAPVDSMYFDIPQACRAQKHQDYRDSGPVKISGPMDSILVVTPPTPPIHFTADLTWPYNTTEIYVGFGRIWSDQPNYRTRLDEMYSTPLNDASFITILSVISDKVKNKFSSILQSLLGASCYLTGKYELEPFDYYAWVPLADYQGIYTVNNKTCSMWQLPRENATFWSACFSLDDNSTIVWAANQKTGEGIEEFYFHNFCSHSRISPQTFDLESICKESNVQQNSQGSSIKSTRLPPSHKLLLGPQKGK